MPAVEATPAPIVSDLMVTVHPDMQLPAVAGDRPPSLAVNLVVTPDAILVDGVTVSSLVAATDGGFATLREDELRGTLLIPLFDQLVEKARTAKRIAEVRGVPFDETVLLQVDRRAPFSLVRSVVYTAGQAGFVHLHFVVWQSDEKLAVLTSSLPKITAPTGEDRAPPLGLVVSFSDVGLEVRCNAPALGCDDAPCPLPCLTDGCPDDGHDLAGLQALLRRARQIDAEEQQIIVAARDETRHGALMRVASAVKRDATGPLFADVVLAGQAP